MSSAQTFLNYIGAEPNMSTPTGPAYGTSTGTVIRLEGSQRGGRSSRRRSTSTSRTNTPASAPTSSSSSTTTDSITPTNQVSTTPATPATEASTPQTSVSRPNNPTNQTYTTIQTITYDNILRNRPNNMRQNAPRPNAIEPYQEPSTTQKMQSTAQRFATSFSGGYTLSPKTGANLRGEGGATNIERVGALSGTIAGIATVGSASSIYGRGASIIGKAWSTLKTSSVVGPTVRAVESAYQSSRVIRYGGDVATGVATAETTRKTTGAIGERRTSDTNPYITDPVVKRSVAYGFSQEAAAIKENEGFFRNIGYELTPLLSNQKNVYDQSTKAYLRAAGYTGDSLTQATSAADTIRTTSAISEATSLVALSGRVEMIGRREVSKALSRRGAGSTFTQGFSRVGGQIGIAGTVEGGVGSFSQSKNRGQPVDYRDIAFAAAAGGLSASLIGGTIAGTTVAGKTRASNWLQRTAYLVDPFEKPGDVVADVLQASTRTTVSTIPVNPTVTSRQFSGRSTTRRTNYALTSPITVPEVVPPVNIPPNTNVPTNTNVNTNVPVDTNVPTNIYTRTNVNTNINTNIPVMTNIYTSTFTYTPLLRTPVFSPIMPPRGGSGVGFGGFAIPTRQPKAYAPSLYATVAGITADDVDPFAIKSGLGIRPVIRRSKSGRGWLDI